MVVTASSDKTARLWDVKSRRQTAVLIGHSDEVESAEFSPDGRMVVTGSDDLTVRIWDVETGKQIVLLNPEGVKDGPKGVTVAFSPLGKTVMTAFSDAVL
jgi:WD40 repeat protein